MSSNPEDFNSTKDFVSVRYMVDDVDAAVGFYTKHLGFTVRMSAAPAFADVVRGQLRLLLSGPTSSAGRPMPDGAVPAPGGWNRIHLIVSDIAAEVDRLRAVAFRSGTTLSGDRAASRSCWRIRPATSLSCSSRPTSKHRETQKPRPLDSGESAGGACAAAGAVSAPPSPGSCAPGKWRRW